MKKHLIKAPTIAALQCSIHRAQFPSDHIGDGMPHIWPLLGLTRILKIDTKEGQDVHLWYLSNPELTEGNIEVYSFPTGAQVPSHLSYVSSVILTKYPVNGEAYHNSQPYNVGRGESMLDGPEVYHFFVNPQSFPKDRPYITH